MGFIIGAIVAFLLLAKTNILGSLGASQTIAAVQNPNTTSPTYTPANANQQLAIVDSAITQEGQLASTANTTATAALTAIGIAGQAASAIPVVGAAVSAVISIFVAASKKRAQEASSENQAVDAAIPPWDALVQQCAQMLNSGSMTPQEAGVILGTPRTAQNFGIPAGVAWQRFWQEVGPQVQPGRNGCQNGSVTQGGISFCGGKTYGAACCIAYDDLDNSMGNPNLPSDCFFSALKKATAQPGTTFTATILGIYPSKYSTFSRPSYQVQITIPHL
jgi:hypothetical protein